MQARTPRLFSISFVLALAIACGGKDAPPASPTTPTPAAADKPAGSADKPAADQANKPAEQRYDVDFVEAKATPNPNPLPKVSIDVPGYDQFIPSSLLDATKVRFKVQNWGDMPEGAFIQFILDNKPFRPIANPNENVMLKDLAGSEGLQEGEHIIAAYVSLKNQESIKADSAIAVRRFFFGKRAQGGWNSTKDPLLVVGSPHGSYSGEDVLFDFYVLNAVLSEKEYSVKAIVKGPGIKPEGIRRVITSWKPWILLSTHNGDYTVEAELLDANGEMVPGAWNSFTRTFTVKR